MQHNVQPLMDSLNISQQAHATSDIVTATTIEYATVIRSSASDWLPPASDSPTESFYHHCGQCTAQSRGCAPPISCKSTNHLGQPTICRAREGKPAIIRGGTVLRRRSAGGRLRFPKRRSGINSKWDQEWIQAPDCSPVNSDRKRGIQWRKRHQ